MFNVQLPVRPFGRFNFILFLSFHHLPSSSLRGTPKQPYYAFDMFASGYLAMTNYVSFSINSSLYHTPLKFLSPTYGELHLVRRDI